MPIPQTSRVFVDDLEEVVIPSGREQIHGDLTVPDNAQGLALFAHGSGSSRFSPRNRFVAARLNGAGFATLLMDLLTEEEERVDNLSGQYRFNVELLARRLLNTARWLDGRPESGLPRGYFGSSTGAAAALIAAAQAPKSVAAVVSRGGRPDMAGGWLAQVEAPTLLIVGGYDWQVIELNEDAYKKISAVKRMEIVPGATHLFEEPGKLEVVFQLAARWFGEYLKG